ncbi:MAG: hypothetical protein LBJ01_10410 [Tannerella sp.]|jgi:Mor family transcriptional regulator|nr:hypothetical protein [Tannerella sp.]
MTVYEILSFTGELLTRLALTGFNLKDCRYVDLYSEYDRMRRAGEKITYIISALSDKYKVSERKIYGIIKQLKKDCRIGAV